MLRRRSPESNARLGSSLAAIFVATLSLALAACDAGGEGVGNGDATDPANEEVVKATPEGSNIPEVIGAPAIADPAPGVAGSDERHVAFAAATGERIEEKPNVRGDDAAWFFLVRELKQMGLGQFWEKDWSEVAQNQTDPVPSMVALKDLLAAKGIDLIVVPIPAKASIYPDKLDASFGPGDPYPLTPFLERMTAAGLHVIDLEPTMRQLREAEPENKLWCEQDAHYTPLACEIVAGLVKEELAKGEWFAAHPKEQFARTEPTPLEIVGDQVKGSEWEGQVPKETLSVRYAGRDKDGRIEPVDPDAASPILLLGDSHTLVFQEGANGGMHCQGAGLLDQLAYETGIVPDLVGVRGSGLVQARKQLYRTAAPVEGYWENKKAVVWVFSVREFTQSFDKIMEIPIEKPE